MSVMDKPNSILKDKVMIGAFAWAFLFYVLGFVLSKFFLFSIGLLPLALYELFRTEGVKNTKPLSALVSIVLVLQILHSTGIFEFPFDIMFLLEILPVTISDTLDPFIFASVIALIIMSFLLIKYTWGSITKFLAIALLIGSLLQATVFWREVSQMLESDQGQELIDDSKDDIQENIKDRIEQELF